MCHFLPVHHLEIGFLGRVEGQNITKGKEKKKFRDRCYHLNAQSNQLGVENTPTALLQRGKTPSNVGPSYYIKPSDGEAPTLGERQNS